MGILKFSGLAATDPNPWDKITNALLAKEAADATKKAEHVCALPVYTLVKPIRVVNVVRTETVLDNTVNATANPDICPPEATDVTSSEPKATP